ncbi:MAG: hypothetical protein H3C50_05965 [Kiritimatiellae bacterium]|nr:hypothetical protein [Kiritimatiellia bacterium]MCO5060908.1 hypothetical protein [Kiritimatiellia bacterium]MCO5068177.1 hypothetical protein [Kiritimatiellia bacterium]
MKLFLTGLVSLAAMCGGVTFADCVPTPDSDAARLYTVLQRPRPACLSVGKWHEWADLAMRDMTRREFPPAGLTEFLLGLVRDESADPVLRNYATQHLTLTWMSRVGAREREEIEAVLEACLTDRFGPLAGSALLGLQRMDRAAGDDSKRALRARQAERIVQNFSQDGASRATALSVLTELSPESAVIVGDTVFQHPVESVLLLSVKAGQRSERCVPCLESGSSR